jgi:cobyrinic acid a,c-diamide synthase
MNFLQPFKEITTIMSSSTYSTLSITIPLYNSLIDHTEDFINTENIVSIKEAAEKCKEKLKEYYNKTNETYLIATILDPRFKILYYEENEWSHDEINEINQKLVFLIF